MSKGGWPGCHKNGEESILFEEGEALIHRNQSSGLVIYEGPKPSSD